MTGLPCSCLVNTSHYRTLPTVDHALSPTLPRCPVIHGVYATVAWFLMAWLLTFCCSQLPRARVRCYTLAAAGNYHAWRFCRLFRSCGRTVTFLHSLRQFGGCYVYRVCPPPPCYLCCRTRYLMLRTWCRYHGCGYGYGRCWGWTNILRCVVAVVVLVC